MQRAQRQRRRAYCPRCRTLGSRTHQDHFKRGRLHAVRAIAISYFCAECSRVFEKSWSL